MAALPAFCMGIIGLLQPDLSWSSFSGWQEPVLTLNAMSEEMLLPKKIYREAALSRRCLVLSSGFFEWRHLFPIGKKTGKPLKTAVKYPYHIGVKDHPYFFIAGVWQPWKDIETGEYVETFSVVTTAPPINATDSQ